MIFVTVGTARDFSRLVKKVDEIAPKIKDRIIIQRGNTKYAPKNCKYFEFVSREDFSKYIKRADIVITHAGAGAITSSLNFRKPTIVVPRRKKYNEHRNDHQMDIAKELEREGRVLACYNIEDLERKIKEAGKFKPPKKGQEIDKIKKTLESFIENCMR